MKTLYVIAGEPSGDALGAAFLRAFREQHGKNVRIAGIGGPAMHSEGLKSLFPMEDLAVMGIAEILPRIPKLLERISRTVEDIEKIQPDVVLTIDSPDFGFRVHKRLKARGKSKAKRLHYVAPTVWAWRPERAKKIAGFLDGLLCLFPFEPPYFRKEGLTARFVGHSVLDSGILEADGNAFRRGMGIPESERVLGLFPGSRKGEVLKIGPVLAAAAGGFLRTYPNTQVVIPTFSHLVPFVRQFTDKIPAPVHLETAPARKWLAFKACDLAVAVSGTVGLELAVAGVPHVIAYKMNPITWEIVRRKIRVRFAHLANILLNREVVPEFIQGNCLPDPIAEALVGLERNPGTQAGVFEEIRDLIGFSGEKTPARRAAEFVSEYLSGKA